MPASRSIAILGPGLLGGSLALALRRLPTPPHITIWARRPEAVAEVLSRHIAPAATTDLSAALQDADEVVLCTPMGVLPQLARAALPHLKPGTFVTDVASVKAPVDAALAPLFADRARWIGSHPMAGGEQAGLHAARPDLFDHSRVILTPTASTQPETLDHAHAFWTEIGCTVLTTTPEAHDLAVAQISHLPHLLAALLVNAVQPDALAFHGPGFRDTTRVAAGPTAMWSEILLENRQAVLAALANFQHGAERARAALESANEKELHDLLAAANHVRRSLTSPA